MNGSDSILSVNFESLRTKANNLFFCFVIIALVAPLWRLNWKLFAHCTLKWMCFPSNTSLIACFVPRVGWHFPSHLHCGCTRATKVCGKLLEILIFVNILLPVRKQTFTGLECVLLFQCKKCQEIGLNNNLSET